jgi:hypothetical protein
MSAIEELRKARAQAEQDKAREAAEKAERQKEKLYQDFALQFGQALMDELEAQPGHSGRYPFVTLTYRGRSRRWDKGGGGDAYIATPASLAEWIDKVDAEMVKWAEKRDEARLRVVEMELNGFALNMEMDAVEGYRLREFADVREALGRYEAKCRTEAEREKHERRAAIKLDVQNFASRISAALCAKTREELREIAECRERHEYPDYPRHVRVVARRLESALEDGWERMRKADELREAQRAQAEREAFRPFVFYRVHYGVVAHDDEETFVETRSIDALYHPDGNTFGAWMPVRGYPVELTHLVMVEHVAVTSVEELPGWCPKVETEWGSIRVAPDDAKFLVR